MPSDEVWNTPERIQHTQLMLDSFERYLGRSLIDRSGNSRLEAEKVFRAPFVVVSHGTQDDPILNYGNATALEMWEMDFTTLTPTPSRLTAEPVHRDERARLLKRTTEDGFVDDYRGIRISRTGKRFQIHQAIVWNLLDTSGVYRGQAATFSEWDPLPSS
mgnify:FL=1